MRRSAAASPGSIMARRYSSLKAPTTVPKSPEADLGTRAPASALALEPASAALAPKPLAQLPRFAAAARATRAASSAASPAVPGPDCASDAPASSDPGGASSDRVSAPTEDAPPKSPDAVAFAAWPFALAFFVKPREDAMPRARNVRASCRRPDMIDGGMETVAARAPP